MIKIIISEKEAGALAAEQLVGKYVMLDGHTYWESLRIPRFVSAVSGSRVHIDEVTRYLDDKRKIWLLSADDGKRTPDGYVSKKGIRCICDTVEECNQLALHDRKIDEEVKVFKQNIVAQLKAFDGKTEADF